MIMKITCGTWTPESFEIDIDDYGLKTKGSNVTPEQEERATNLLYLTMNDATFINDGYRNDDAVNSCIALHVLGFDPSEWFDNFFDDNNKDNKFHHYDIELFMEHVDRVIPYLSSWGPKDNEGKALDKAIM